MKIIQELLADLHRPKGSPPLALIVDDDPRDSELTGRALNDAGCRYIAAQTGEAAVSMLTESVKHENESIDIVFLDLKLPGMSGVDVLRWIRRTIPSLIVIVITHAAYSQMIADAASEGFVELIEKPFSSDTVTEILLKHKL